MAFQPPKQNAISTEDYLAGERGSELKHESIDVQVGRRSNHWQPAHYYFGDQLHLTSLDLYLPVHEIYVRLDNDDMTVFPRRPQVNPLPASPHSHG